jgi:hypothetical protein
MLRPALPLTPLQEDNCKDFCCSFWCNCCTLAQMLRHVYPQRDVCESCDNKMICPHQEAPPPVMGSPGEGSPRGGGPQTSSPRYQSGVLTSSSANMA